MIEHLHLAELGLKGVEQDCGVEVSVRVVFTDDAVVVYSDCVHGDFSLRKEKGDRSRPVGLGNVTQIRLKQESASAQPWSVH